jgi:hypothetical protein
MNKSLAIVAVGALLGVTACSSSGSTVVRMSNVWSTTCSTGGQSVVVSAPTLPQFHTAVEGAPECARGYTATAPSN